MTPERMAAMEAAAAAAEADVPAAEHAPAAPRLDEDVSPVTGRRFTRA